MTDCICGFHAKGGPLHLDSHIPFYAKGPLASKHARTHPPVKAKM